MSPVLIAMFAASLLLLALAAVPPTWSMRLGFAARLADVRGGLALAGGFILVESAVVALLLAT